MKRIKFLHPLRHAKAQAFIELALVVPILLLLIVGVADVAMVMGRYLDMLQLTREGARYASQQNPALRNGAANCGDLLNFDFYFHTACMFMSPSVSVNGMNTFMDLDSTKDDIVITVFKVTDHSADYYESSTPYYWAKYGNYNKDCQGGVSATNNLITTAYFNSPSKLNEDGFAPANEGFVAVELYYCYTLPINIPAIPFSFFIPSPLRLHAYTIMSLPKAQPLSNP